MNNIIICIGISILLNLSSELKLKKLHKKVIEKIGAKTVLVWFELELIRRCKQYLVAACNYILLKSKG